MGPRIVIISPTTRIVPDVAAAFGALWPDAALAHMVDETIYQDVMDRKLGFTPAVSARLLGLLKQGEAAEAKAMMFTGSIFGAAIEALRASVSVPVATSSQGLIEDSFAAPAKAAVRRIGIVATVAQSIVDLERDMARYAAPKGLRYVVESEVETQARALFVAGRRAEADALVVAAADRFRDVDVLVLPQFSLTAAHAALPAVAGRTALCAARSAVGVMQRLAGAASRE